MPREPGDDRKPQQDVREGAEPDRQGTTDAMAGAMEGDIAAEPPRGGAARTEPEDEPGRQAGDRARADASASGLRQGDQGGEDLSVAYDRSLGARRAAEVGQGGADPSMPARQAGGEDELSPGRDDRTVPEAGHGRVPTAEGEQTVPRRAGDADEREDAGWSQPESSAQKLE